MYSYSYLEGESTTQLETGMSKIIEEGPTCFSKPSSKMTKKNPKKNTQAILSKVLFKNAFVTGLTNYYIQ